MNGTDLRVRREALGLSPLDLADLLDEPPEQILAWERMSAELPGGVRRRVNWVLAQEERKRA